MGLGFQQPHWNYEEKSIAKKTNKGDHTPLHVTVHHRILLLGLEQYWYWIIGYSTILADIGQYCYWEIFFHCDTQYDTDRTAVGTVHMDIGCLAWYHSNPIFLLQN